MPDGMDFEDEDVEPESFAEGESIEGPTQSGSFLFAAGDGVRRPVTDLYAAFRRPRTAADRESGELAHTLGTLGCGPDEDVDDPFPPELPDHLREELSLGEVIEDKGRLLLAGLGGGQDKLYAAPTTKDAIAYAVLPDGGGGCSVPGPDGLVLSYVWSPESLVLHGLVADGVVAVDVIVDGEARPAEMGENGFGLRMAAVPQSNLDRIVLHRQDGTRNEIDLGFD
jgi:hypothetical protein